jgi:4-nitrophenyl phosphatase
MSDNLAWLKEIRALVFDMDGVLWRGKEALPGLNEIFDWMTAERIPYLLATNNSMSTAQMYVERLAGHGVTVPKETIITSGIAVRDYLRLTYPPDVTVGAVGMKALIEVLFDEGGFVRDDHRPQVQVVGTDLHFGYDDIKRACLAIRAGAAFVATNPDTTLPTEEGLVPGCGAMIAALVASTDVQPTVIGKPEKYMFELACTRLGLQPQEVLMVGDRLDTDILGGNRAGSRTVLVLTGVSQREEITTTGIEPTMIATDLVELLDRLKAVRSNA